MGEVWLARLDGAADFSRRVVIKRLLSHLDDDPEFLSRFIDEARIAAGLSHANIVPVLDLGQDDDGLFLVMEWVDGWDLRKLLRTLDARGERLPDALGLLVAAELASALGYAHGTRDASGAAQHIVHRDVSPSNVLISRAGDVKLTDFGIASARSRIARSHTGQLRGKFAYMSPEQASGAQVDHRSDQYALGALLHELLTGAKAFDGDADVEVLDRVRAGDHEPLRALRPDLPPDVLAIVERAMGFDPTDRFADTHALESALRLALATHWPGTSRTDLAHWLEDRVEGDPLFRAQDQPGGASLDAILLAQLEGAGTGQTASSPARDRSSTRSATGRIALRRPASGEGSAPGMRNREHTLTRAAPPPSARRRRGRVATLGVIAALAVAGALAASLWPAPSQLVVRTEPAGAQVYVDGIPVGVSDLRAQIDAGEHEIHVRLPGYHAVTRQVRGAARQTTELELTLEPADRLVTFNSVPAGATVSVNGHQIVAGNAAPIPVGEPVTVRMELEGHEPLEERVTFTATDTIFTRRLAARPRPEPVAPDTTPDEEVASTREAAADRAAERDRTPRAPSTPAVDPEPTPGTLVLRFAAPPMVGDIAIDGRAMGRNSELRTPFPLAPGDHEILVRNDAAGVRFEAAISVEPGEEVPLTVEWRRDE
jgi:serine/threonine-protein kinase